MNRAAIIAFGASILAGAAHAQIVELPASFNRFDISGVKLGDSPDTVIAALKERGYGCDFTQMQNADGSLINSNGHAGAMECKTNATVQKDGKPIHRGEILVQFGNRDLSGNGTDASKVFATYIEFSEKYPDQPSIETMNARLTEKYGELAFNSHSSKWTKTGKSAPDLEKRKAAFKNKEKQCDAIARAQRVAKLECSLEEAELQYAYLAGRPADLTAKYRTGNSSSYSEITITANWTHWDAVRTRRRTAATTEAMIAEAAAGPQADKGVETTF